MEDIDNLIDPGAGVELLVLIDERYLDAIAKLKMSSKRKATSGPATVAADDGDAHAAKRRKLPVSTTIVHRCESVLWKLIGFVVGWRKLNQAAAVFKHTSCSLDWIGPMV